MAKQTQKPKVEPKVEPKGFDMAAAIAEMKETTEALILQIEIVRDEKYKTDGAVTRLSNLLSHAKSIRKNMEDLT